MTLASGGRIVIPSAYRKALNIRPGDEVVLQLEGDSLRLTSPLAALRRLRSRVADAVPRDVSLVDELIAERRESATRGE